MRNCTDIDPLVTPYVDGEMAAADRAAVDAHLRECPPCHMRVMAEQAIRDLVRARKLALTVERAPGALRARCAARPSPAATDGTRHAVPAPWAGRRAPRVPATWRARIMPVALAASLMLVVGGAFLYQLTASSSRVLAAELTADHLKCFAINELVHTDDAPESVESWLASSFGWRMHLPEHADREGLELVGSRPCLYAEGRVAHIMYRYHGRPVSVFMLPKTTRPDGELRVLGHEASIWSVGDRTFVLIAREARPEIQRMVSFVHSALR